MAIGIRPIIELYAAASLGRVTSVSVEVCSVAVCSVWCVPCLSCRGGPCDADGARAVICMIISLVHVLVRGLRSSVRNRYHTIITTLNAEGNPPQKTEGAARI